MTEPPKSLVAFIGALFFPASALRPEDYEPGSLHLASSKIRSALAIAAGAALVMMAGLLVWLTVYLLVFVRPSGADIHDRAPFDTARWATAAFFLVGSVFTAWHARRAFRAGRTESARRRQAHDELRVSTLPQRAQRAIDAISEATVLFEELREELDARTALLGDVRRQLGEVTGQLGEIRRLNDVDAETTRILNRYFDRALERRLGQMERTARKRDSLNATVTALAVGIVAILASHYLFGF